MFSVKFVMLALALASTSFAVPTHYQHRREVPQEHSHEPIVADVRKLLAISNPQNIGDPIFSLLGAAAAAKGLGNTKDVDCLQQAVADQAFTNAKASNDVAGMTSALIFRALERNSGSVGTASPLCTSVKAVNPEIAAVTQHQDPAGSGAQAANKAVVLELAKQIDSIGGTATDALKSGTFAPGKIGDPTAAGNTCDDANDAAGCIFSQNLLVEDATADEIAAAVAGGASSSAATGAASSSAGAASSSSADAASSSADAASSSAGAADATAASSSAAGDFGSCSVPQIEFGAGFDGRKETSFEPVDKKSFNHGSAQAIGIISQFICDTLTNSCKADATAKATCAKAITAANAQPPKTGAQADAFNAAFGITTQFAQVTALSDQGVAVAGGAAAATPAGNANIAVGGAAGNVLVASGAGDFGSCSVPQIEFGVGFDGRKETSFEPVDKASYNHGSAQAIGIISQFICDTLTNKCGADAAAKATCATAITAANAQPPKTGAQADAFNAAFGVKTAFANVAAVSDQGVVVSAGAGAAATAPAAAAQPAAAQPASAAATGGNLQTFTGSLGATAPPVTNTGSGAQPFSVEGNASFNNLQNALVRSCDVQHNKCANAANSSGNSGALTVDACQTQQDACNAQAKA